MSFTPSPTVLIGGELRPVRFGYAALADLTRESGLNLPEISAMLLSGSLRFDVSIKLAWAGLKQGARYNSVPFPYTWENVADWVDERAIALNEVLEVWEEHNASQLKKNESDNDKKKQDPTESPKT